MSALTISGQVVDVRPTKGGKWLQVILAGSALRNDLVMVPIDADAAKGIKPGVHVDHMPVRASVETQADGMPTKQVVYFLSDRAAA
jgi:hypothetical protein